MNIPSYTELETLRLQGDSLADATIAKIWDSENPYQMLQKLWAISHNAAWELADLPTYLHEYFQKVKQEITPEEAIAIQHSTHFFRQYAQAYLGMLGLLALPYCYAGEYGAQVLYLSDRIHTKTEKRLLETTKFILDVLSPEAFSPVGKAWVSIAQVRLVHALIRKKILNLPAWDMRWGLPVNQEDMLGTNFAFSWIVLRGMEKIGYPVQSKDREALLVTWRVIGKGLGVLPDIMPSKSKEAYWLDKRIVQRQFRASEVGKALTASLVGYLNPKFPYGLTETYMRYLLGDTIADYLGIAPIDWKKNLLRIQVLQTTFKDYLPFALPTQFLAGDAASFLAQLQDIMQKEAVAFNLS